MHLLIHWSCGAITRNFRRRVKNLFSPHKKGIWSAYKSNFDPINCSPSGTKNHNPNGDHRQKLLNYLLLLSNYVTHYSYDNCIEYWLSYVGYSFYNSYMYYSSIGVIYWVFFYHFYLFCKLVNASTIIWCSVLTFKPSILSL